MCTIFTHGYCSFPDGEGLEYGITDCDNCPYSEPEKEEELLQMEEKYDDCKD